MVKINADEKSKLKGEGFLPQRQEGYFALRVITKNGCSTTEQLKVITDIANKYGRGYVSYTTRLTVEIPWIKYEDIDKVKEELRKAGLTSGGTGNRLRPITACKSRVCKYGFVDTQALAEKIHNRFFEEGLPLPHKFKIGVGGCPNNCIKPDLNDFGIVGQRLTYVDKDICSSCKKCIVIEGCPMGAPKTSEEGTTIIDKEKCNNCGRCVRSCYFKAVKFEKEGYKIYIGGKWGKRSRPGNALKGIYTEEEVMAILEKAILYYKNNGMPKERFGDMIERIGIEKVQKALLNE